MDRQRIAALPSIDRRGVSAAITLRFGEKLILQGRLNICGSNINTNTANEGGGAIFFVSNDLTGTLTSRDSSLSANPSAGFETAGYPGIFYLGQGTPLISNSSLQ